MLSHQLRDQTKSNHLNLEKVLVLQIKDIRSKDDYGKILSMFYQYFGALEQEIDKYIGAEVLPDYHLRRKAASLKNDLEQLGYSGLATFNNSIPDIHNYRQALGALYVIEGSTLGGEIISKMVRSVLGDQIEPALSFFKGYGADSKLMWEKFQNTINEVELNTGQLQEVIQTANQTFIKFRELALSPVS